MTEARRLPVGFEFFDEIRQNHLYYVDKTKLIEQLLDAQSKVTLFTRPRRFGKTLNMSMLKSFFEIGTEPTLFDGLYIANQPDLCQQHMGKYPVIFLSLKDVDGLTYSDAEDAMIQRICHEAARFSFLLHSPNLSEAEKEQYRGFTAMQGGNYRMDTKVLVASLKVLSQLLCQHYGQQVVLLIDEYDVPLDKAFQHGYYREMVALIRGLFGQALKTNPFLHFAILTGCLRISKESIFTGLNNFKVFAIDDVRYQDAFGFTAAEVQQLLLDYNLQSHFDEIRAWYDGYHFGHADIYCPWDVINYVDDLVANPQAKPKTYWINSSGNDLVKRFIDKADTTTRDEIEQLIAGEAVEKRIRLDLAYDELDTTIDNIWSVLFTTGYLTQVDEAENGFYKLMIPNREVREVFVLQISDWFNRVVASESASTGRLNRAFLDGQADGIERELTMFLGETISILDTKARREEKENFYHGILIGLLKSNPHWAVKSNREAGDGFADILVKPKDPDTGIIIELKYAPTMKELDQACERALAQIHARRYDEALREDGRNEILAYGIAFCKKRCKVRFERL